jgi:hypothetical protein
MVTHILEWTEKKDEFLWSLAAYSTLRKSTSQVVKGALDDVVIYHTEEVSPLSDVPYGRIPYWHLLSFLPPKSYSDGW